MLVCLLLVAVALAGGLDGLRPAELVQTAVVWERQGDKAVVVDRNAGLWVGEGKLRQVDTLTRVPNGVLLGDELLLWTISREGLWTSTTVEMREPSGEVIRREEREGPALFATDLQDGAAVALPGALLLLNREGATWVKLPFVSPESVDEDEGLLRVYGEGGQMVLVDRQAGCARPLPDEGQALTRLLRWEASLDCGGVAPPTAVLIEAAEAREAAIRGAILARSPTLLAGLGVRSRADLAALAPKPSDAGTKLTQLPRERISTSKTLFGDYGGVILQDLALDLSGWASQPWGPACSAEILLSASTPRTALRNDEALADLMRSNPTCGEHVKQLDLGALPDVPGARYVSASGELLARRVGTFGPMQVRLDIASLTPRGDKLNALGSLPLYAPSWVLPAALATEALLDVDGSLIAATGWEILRVDPSGKRSKRVALPGPVSGLSVRKNGTIDARVGGQRVVVDLERDEVHYHAAATGSVEPPPNAGDPGPWAVDGRVLSRPASASGPAVRLELPIEIRAFSAARGGAVLDTALGLFGVDASGKLMWRLPDAGAWAVYERTLYVSTVAGIYGFELGR